MPIIIDANRACDFSTGNSSHAPEIMRNINERRLRVVLGGRLSKELAKTKLLSIIAEWTRAGCVRQIDDGSVDRDEERFKNLSLASNDPHVLALASISGCRLIFTCDSELIEDLKNPKLLKPKGNVITSATPAKATRHLLAKHAG